MVFTRGRVESGGEGGRGLKEGCQKIQTSNYKVKKYKRCKLPHEKYDEHFCVFCVLHMKLVKRVNPKSLQPKEKNCFYFFFFVFIEMMNSH